MEDEILSLEKAAMERWRNGDPMGWAEISAEHVTYIDPGQTKPINGLEAYRNFLKQLEGKVHYQGSEFIEPRVVRVGEAALLTYNYRSIVCDAEGKVTSQTPWNTTEVYFKQGGSWKIVHTHWSFIHHRAPTKTEVPILISSSQDQPQELLEELMLLERGAMERWRKGDPGGFIEISTPEVTYMDTGTPQRLNGIDALSEEYARRVGKIYYDVMDFIEPMVQVQGDMAILFYRFLSTWLHADGSVKQRTPWNCTEVYVRREGEWKIAHTHWSLIGGLRIDDYGS